MNLVLLTHPAFLGSQSQPQFARMLAEAYRSRGHTVQVRQPRALLRRRIGQGPLAKWAGYVDQYLLFPPELRRAARRDPEDTLYVFCDQALGPWMPLLAHRPHVVHCHDLLALRSALGDIAENPTSATGRVYQRYIRAGFRRARHFISISEQSRADLHHFGGVTPLTSEVVYNGLSHPYRRLPEGAATAALQRAGLPTVEGGLLLHVGGGQWYKNSVGVLQLYAQYARLCGSARRAVLPLWMVSPPPQPAEQVLIDALPEGARVQRVQGLPHAAIEALYSVAAALLFPSLAEGFGWPIAEALACGCPVLTTGEPPMNEVGGSHAHYLPRLQPGSDVTRWAADAALKLLGVLDRPPADREAAAAAGVAWARRYDADRAIDAYLRVYECVLAQEAASLPLRRGLAS